MTEIELWEKADKYAGDKLERKVLQPWQVDLNVYMDWKKAYCIGYKDCEASPEYQQLMKGAEKWKLMIGRINDWSEQNEDGPTDKVIADIWWEVHNDE